MKQKQRIALFGVVAVALILAACDSDSGNNSLESEEDSSSSVEISLSSEQINSSSVVKSSSSSVKGSSSSVVASSSSVKLQSSSSVPLSSSTIESSSSSSIYGSFIYGGQTYRTVTIGTQTWMAENLNYEVNNSWCYNSSADSCAKYGRLYQWTSAMTACPDGWHLPNNDDWQTLYDYVDANNGDEGVGTSLKSTGEWNAFSGVTAGTDRFGFSALPAGRRFGNGDFDTAGNNASFWSATEIYSDYADFWYLYYYNGDFGSSDFNSKDNGVSVRCLKDSAE